MNQNVKSCSSQNTITELSHEIQGKV